MRTALRTTYPVQWQINRTISIATFIEPDCLGIACTDGIGFLHPSCLCQNCCCCCRTCLGHRQLVARTLAVAAVAVVVVVVVVDVVADAEVVRSSARAYRYQTVNPKRPGRILDCNLLVVAGCS